MKIINDLIVVEVPKGTKIMKLNSLLYVNEDPSILMPFPCTIIGLYSEVVDNEEKREEVLHYGRTSGLVYTMLLDAGIETTDTTDLLFLKRN